MWGLPRARRRARKQWTPLRDAKWTSDSHMHQTTLGDHARRGAIRAIHCRRSPTEIERAKCTNEFPRARPNPRRAMTATTKPASKLTETNPIRHPPRPRIQRNEPEKPIESEGQRAGRCRRPHLTQPTPARRRMNERFPMAASTNPRPQDVYHRRNPELAAAPGPSYRMDPSSTSNKQGHQQRPARAHPSKRTLVLPPSAPARSRSARALGWARYLVHRPLFNLNILTVPSTPPLRHRRAHVSEHEFSGTNPSARRARALGGPAFCTNELRRAHERTEATFAQELRNEPKRRRSAGAVA